MDKFRRKLKQQRQRENWSMLQKQQPNAHKYKGIDDDGVDDVRHIENHISPLTKIVEMK